MTELDAIRARDADCGPLDEYVSTEAAADRRALLAEVDRLTAALDIAIAGRERERTLERARIRAAVEGLVPEMVRKDMLKPDPKWEDLVTRAAVLAAIEGGDR